MRGVWKIAGCVLAALSGACSSNGLLHAPMPPEQKTSFHPEDARSYNIRELNAKVADDQQDLYEAQRNTSLDLACVQDENWDVKTPDDPDVTFLVKGRELDPAEARSVQATLDYFGGAFRKLEYEYARFQDFRRLYDGAQHDKRLLNVAIQQGLATMFAGRRLLDFAGAFEADHCSLRPFRKGLKAAAGIVSDVGQGQLPALMHTVDEGDHWAGTLMGIQLAIASAGDALTPCSAAARDLGGVSTGYDTSIYTWCGYAAARADQTEQAKQYWGLAGRSVHDPEGASYALARLRDLSEATAAPFGKVKVTPIKAN
jgi:hypothetical protein